MTLLHNLLYPIVVSFLGIEVRAVSEGHGTARCLLQNQFVNEKLSLTDEEVSQIKRRDSAELQSLQEQLLLSTVRRREYLAHSFHVRRMLASLKNASKLEMTSLSSVHESKREKVLSDEGNFSFTDLGGGCCSNGNLLTMVFKGFTVDLNACRRKCESTDNCAYFEYGWKESGLCILLPRGTDCSSLDNGPEDCGSGGGNNGVHTFQLHFVQLPNVAASTGTSIVLTTSELATASSASLDDMNDLGSGCCTNRNVSSMLFKGMVADLDECKEKCRGLDGCGFIEYGWKDSNWCTIIPESTDCSTLADGPEDCGSGGGDNGVHTYEMLSGALPSPHPDENELAVPTPPVPSVAPPQSSTLAAPSQSSTLASTPAPVPTTPSIVGKGMDDLLGTIIDSQSGSEDTCHSQLREAKHQLNQLHVLVIDLARQVNNTEEQLMMFDTELQEKLREMSEVSAWQKDEVQKCKVQTESAKEMFVQLKSELSQMTSIANPKVVLNVADGKLVHIEAENSGKVSLAQTGQEIKHHKQHQSMTIDFSGDDHKAVGHHLAQFGRHISNHEVHMSSVHRPSHNLDNLSGLLRATRQASQKFRKCIESVHSAHMSVTLLSEGAPKITSNECEKLKVSLQQTYVKAYVELSRMQVEYEELANSTACSASVHEQYKNQKTPLQDEADKLSGEINDKTEEMQTLRPRLQSAQASEVKLRDQVNQLTNQCAELSPTISALDSVRDAINALSACPGLKTVKFSLPKWTGKWVTFHQDSTAQTDTEQDKLMNSACNSDTEGSRAAEVGEIQEQTVQGIPNINSAPTPLLGACPACQGERDDSFQSGHSRVCWDPGVSLSMEHRRINCGAGKKAILCVIDA